MVDIVTSRSDEIERLYQTERRRLERMVTRKVGPSQASDVVQEVFARIWEKAKEHVVLTPSYLSRCASNSAIDQLRVEKRHKALAEKITADQYAAPVATPLQIVDGPQLHHGRARDSESPACLPGKLQITLPA